MYMKNFPEDSFLFDDLRDDTTVQDVVDSLNKGEDIYQVIFGDQGGDSIVRENIFGYLADTLNVDYEDIYNLWVHPEKAKKLQEAEDVEDKKDVDEDEIKNTETEEERDKRIFDELANSEESKTTLDLLQDRIGQALSV